MKKAITLLTTLALMQPAHTQEVMHSATKANAVPGQPWQERRMELARTLQEMNKGNAEAIKDFDRVLTDFDTHPLAKTPIENMEILGIYYLPREGVQKVLPIVVLNATLGWYDALRFASASGRAEISQSLFKMPFVVAGQKISNEARSFFDEDPAKTQELVESGIDMANRFRDGGTYDRHWPTGFGLERITCVQGGPCEAVKPLPASKWDAAWEEAKQRVRVYYRGSKPIGPNVK